MQEHQQGKKLTFQKHDGVQSKAVAGQREGREKQSAI